MTRKYFNLIPVVLSVFIFVQCVQKEEEIAPINQFYLKMSDEIEKLPSIVDPDPVIKEPDYGQIFAANFSLDLLHDISTSENEVPAPILKILNIIESNANILTPSLNALLANVDKDFILEVMNPENPLDPHLEEILKRMLEMEKVILPLPKYPEIEIDLFIDSISPTMAEQNLEPEADKIIAIDLESECAKTIRDDSGSGYRGCSDTFERNYVMIDENYRNRLKETENRLVQRNEFVKQFFSLSQTHFAQVSQKMVELINNKGLNENFGIDKNNFKFIALVYSYYIRVNFSSFYQYALAVNQMYYQQELHLMNKQKIEKLEEANTVRDACMVSMDKYLEEEIKRRCPQEES